MREYARLYWDKKKDCSYNHYILTGICTRCGKHYRNNNLFASSYCQECSKVVAREKTRERVRRFRERQVQRRTTVPKGTQT